MKVAEDETYIQCIAFWWRMQRWHYQCQVCVIRPVSPLPYNLGSPYWIHTLIMVYTFQLDMHHLILTSFSRFFDFVKVLHETDETYICLHLYKLLLVYVSCGLFLYSGYPCIQGNFQGRIQGAGGGAPGARPPKIGKNMIFLA